MIFKNTDNIFRIVPYFLCFSNFLSSFCRFDNPFLNVLFLFFLIIYYPRMNREYKC